MTVYLYGFFISFFCCFLIAYGRGAWGTIMFSGRRATGSGSFSCPETIIVLCAALPFFLLSACRYLVGTDYGTYTEDYVQLIKGVNTYYEKGYYLMCRLIGFFSKDPKALIAVTSAVFVFGTFYILYKRSDQLLLSLYIFFFSYVFFISLNNIRQSIAQVIGLLAVYALADGRKKTFLILGVLAALFHQIALVYLFLGVLIFLKARAWVLTVLSGVWLAISGFFMPFIANNLEKLRFLFPRLVTLLSTYLKKNMYTGRTVGRYQILFAFCMMLIMAVTEYCAPEETADREWSLIKWNQFLLLMTFGLDGSVPALYRIARLFTFGEMVFYPSLLRRIRHKGYRLLVMAFIIGYFALFFYVNYRHGTEGILPYRTIFEAVSGE